MAHKHIKCISCTWLVYPPKISAFSEFSAGLMIPSVRMISRRCKIMEFNCCGILCPILFVCFSDISRWRLPTGYWNWVDLGDATPNAPDDAAARFRNLQVDMANRLKVKSSGSCNLSLYVDHFYPKLFTLLLLLGVLSLSSPPKHNSLDRRSFA